MTKKIIVFKDGNKWCAVREGFVNLQENPTGFGDSKEQAIKALYKAEESYLEELEHME